MKMSQSEILKDSVSDWPINMPGVSKRTRGNGRNGTEQRALEGIWNTSEWRGRANSGEHRRGPVKDCRGVKCSISKDNTTEEIHGCCLCLEPSHRKSSR